MENESQQNKIISLLTKKDLIDIIIIDKFIPISIQTESFNKILIQSGMIDNKNISNYIY